MGRDRWFLHLILNLKDFKCTEAIVKHYAINTLSELNQLYQKAANVCSFNTS